MKRSMTVQAIAASTLLSIIVSSCIACDRREDLDDEYRNSKYWGEVTTKEYDMKDFVNIESDANVNIVYIQSDTFKVVAKGNEKAIDEYSFNIENPMEFDKKPTLVATGNESKGLREVPSIRLYVYAPTLSFISISGAGDFDTHNGTTFGDIKILSMGAGDIDLNDITCGNINISCTGAGDVKVRRLTASNLWAETSGAGDIDLRKVSGVKYADFSATSAGDIDCDIQADTIKAMSQGAGDIDLEVDCKQISVESTGSGEIEIEGNADQLIRGKSALGLITTKHLHAKKVI
ncbi:MAG: DUF2807 domain-containing protein [Prevotellaceae bacterium]|nr:DUF2807 domain-containing protein [Candidatus Colivivens caballi]